MPFFDTKENAMQAVFNAKRESDDSLYYKDWENDKGVFSFHSQIELYFVREGEMEVFVDDCHAILGKGEMSVALSYVPHGYRTPAYSASSALIIPTRLCEEFIHATKNKRVANPLIRDPATVEKILSLFGALRRDNINEIERQGYIYVILGIVMDALEFVDTPRPLDTSLASKILFYVNEHYKDGITPSDVACALGYSESHISRYFKEKLGITLCKYLTIIKLKNAVTLMHERKHSITYCAIESGFNSMRSFYRAFTEEFACSPKEYLQKRKI